MIVAIVMTACSQDDTASTPQARSDTPIAFSVDVKGTRGTMVNASSFKSLDFGLTAIMHKIPSSVADSVPNFMFNVPVTNATGSWSTELSYLWPEDDYLSFYAYSPYNGKGISLDKEQKGDQIIDYTVADTLENQCDLMTAVKKSQMYVVGGSPYVSLTFTHALTAVTFRVNSMPAGTIKEINFTKLYMSGKYDMTAQTWDFDGKIQTSFHADINRAIAAGGAAQDITGETQTFLMIPQEFTSDEGIQVVFNNGLKNYTLVKSLAGTSWPQGKHITYNMHINSLYDMVIDGVDVQPWADGDERTGTATAQ